MYVYIDPGFRHAKTDLCGCCLIVSKGNGRDPAPAAEIDWLALQCILALVCWFYFFFFALASALDPL